MSLIPKVKTYTEQSGVCLLSKINWQFAAGTDERVIKAAERIAPSTEGVIAAISHGDAASEGYILEITESEVKITGESARGAFYALATLKMLIKQGNGAVKCCQITDRPDTPYRGFYQDTTRGRIGTMETLKKLIDTMADYKMNALQLYVEHSFDFKEYEHCKEKLGYLTADEIRELDAYCKDRFIELTPSLATFGHLYHLLQSDKYKHLCELKDYEPTQHYWVERMLHHTINPLLDESFELVTSLIDQHMPAFTSEYFNICCDETFDLGNDVNAGKDKDDLYVNYVLKLVKYLESKGKKTMMWGDRAVVRSGRIDEFPDSTIFLNWGYDKNPNNPMIEELKNYKQCVCPGTSSWLGFTERVDIEESNITTLAKAGYANNTLGILNTNWGDLGNPASIEMAMYGLILGAALGWEEHTTPDAEFRKAVSEYHYGNPEAVNMLAILGEACAQSDWLIYHYNTRIYLNQGYEDFANAQKKCTELIKRLEGESFITEDLKNEFLIAARGHSLLITWSAKQYGHDVKCDVDFDKWLEDYQAAWLKSSKPGELPELVAEFKRLMATECKDVKSHIGK